MTDDRLEEIRKSLERIGGRTFWNARELLTEFDRLRADERAMKYTFADRCQDGDALGNALRLAREEGRLEALVRVWGDFRPAQFGEGWRLSRPKRGFLPSGHIIPDALFDLLEGGEAAEFNGWRFLSWPDEPSAEDALARALRRLAREWPAEGTP